MKHEFYYSANSAQAQRDFNVARGRNGQPVLAALNDDGNVIGYTEWVSGGGGPYKPKEDSDLVKAGEFSGEGDPPILVNLLGLTERGLDYVRKNNLPETPAAIVSLAVNLK